MQCSEEVQLRIDIILRIAALPFALMIFIGFVCIDDFHGQIEPVVAMLGGIAAFLWNVVAMYIVAKAEGFYKFIPIFVDVTCLGWYATWIGLWKPFCAGDYGFVSIHAFYFPTFQNQV